MLGCADAQTGLRDDEYKLMKINIHQASDQSEGSDVGLWRCAGFDPVPGKRTANLDLVLR